MFVVVFVEFLSDDILIPKIGFYPEYLCTRYAALLYKYRTEKAHVGYISENDHPTRPKSHFTTPTQQNFVDVE